MHTEEKSGSLLQDGSRQPLEHRLPVIGVVAHALAPRPNEGRKLPSSHHYSKPAFDESLGDERKTFESRFASRFFFAFACGMGLLAAIVYVFADSPHSLRNSLRALLPEAFRPSVIQPEFRLGSSTWEVVAIQGPPTSVAGQCWFYAQSKVCFSNNRVVGWYNSPKNPLKLTSR